VKRREPWTDGNGALLCKGNNKRPFGSRRGQPGRQFESAT
jgi:hypothetical protein